MYGWLNLFYSSLFIQANEPEIKWDNNIKEPISPYLTMRTIAVDDQK